MAKKTLVKKNAFTPAKGKFYYIKNGSIYSTVPNRKGGKKGHKVCRPSKTKKTAVRRKSTRRKKK